MIGLTTQKAVPFSSHKPSIFYDHGRRKGSYTFLTLAHYRVYSAERCELLWFSGGVGKTWNSTLFLFICFRTFTPPDEVSTISADPWTLTILQKAVGSFKMAPEVRPYKNVECSLMQTVGAWMAAGIKGPLHWAALMIQFFPLWRQYRCQLEFCCCPAAVLLLWTALTWWSPPGWSHLSPQEQSTTSKHRSTLDGWCVVSSVSTLRGGHKHKWDSERSLLWHHRSCCERWVSSERAAEGVKRKDKYPGRQDSDRSLSALLLRFYVQLPSTCVNFTVLRLQKLNLLLNLVHLQHTL